LVYNELNLRIFENFSVTDFQQPMPFSDLQTFQSCGPVMKSVIEVCAYWRTAYLCQLSAVFKARWR